VRYRQTIERIAEAARQLERCEPLMSKLVDQYSDTVAFGFVTNPTFARDVIADASGNISRQMRLAKMVIDFTREWRGLQLEAQIEMQRQVDKMAAEMEADV
jgi:hypothetical protein